MIDALLKAGLANATDVAVSYDDTSKRVTVRCAKRYRIRIKREKRENVWLRLLKHKRRSWRFSCF